LDENSADAPTSADVLYDKLKRQSQQSNAWEKPTGTPAWEQTAKKNEPSVAVRTMDTNDRLKNILKKS